MPAPAAGRRQPRGARPERDQRHHRLVPERLVGDSRQRLGQRRVRVHDRRRGSGLRPADRVHRLLHLLATARRCGPRRSRALASPAATGCEPYNPDHGSTARNSVLWGGILNLSTRLGATSKLSFNNTYNRSADNEATRLAGQRGVRGRPRRHPSTFTERTVRSHQLTGEHLFGPRHLVDWSLAASQVTGTSPIARTSPTSPTLDPVTGASRPVEWLGGPRSATRTFSDLDESS